MKIYPANTAILLEKVLRTTNKMEWDTWFRLCTEKHWKDGYQKSNSNNLQPSPTHWFSKIYRLQAATGMDFKRQTRQRQRPAMPHTLLQNLEKHLKRSECLALLSCWSLRMEQQRNNDDERMQWKAWRQKGYVPTLKFASLWVKGLWDIRHLWHVRSWESLPWDIIWGSMRFPAMLWTLAVDVRESKKRTDKIW